MIQSADEIFKAAKENLEEKPALALEQALAAAAIYYAAKLHPKVRKAVNFASKAMNPLVGQDALYLMTCDAPSPTRENIVGLIEKYCGHYRRLREMYKERMQIDTEAAIVFDQASFEFKRKIMQRYGKL
jgi:hypothetical protein